jgi:2'-5' RNA ligase
MDAEEQPLIRAFVALAVSDGVRRALEAFESQARRIRVRVGWVKPGNLHVTLVFLGYVPASAVPALASRLDETARLFNPFDFETTGIGWFGGRRPRVIWAGVPPGSGSEAIVKVAGAVRAAVREAGYPDDGTEAFTPHVTVGRLRPGSNPDDLLEFLKSRHAETPFGLSHAGGLRLMRSDLGKEGTVYNVLHESAFDQ